MSCCCFGELSGQRLLDLVVMLLLNATPVHCTQVAPFPDNSHERKTKTANLSS
jgi:hypothetical protein